MLERPAAERQPRMLRKLRPSAPGSGLQAIARDKHLISNLIASLQLQTVPMGPPHSCYCPSTGDKWTGQIMGTALQLPHAPCFWQQTRTVRLRAGAACFWARPLTRLVLKEAAIVSSPERCCL